MKRPQEDAQRNAQAGQGGAAIAQAHLAALRTATTAEERADIFFASLDALLQQPDQNAAFVGFARAMGVPLDAADQSTWKPNTYPTPTREALRREILNWLKAERDGTKS